MDHPPTIALQAHTNKKNTKTTSSYPTLAQPLKKPFSHKLHTQNEKKQQLCEIIRDLSNDNPRYPYKTQQVFKTGKQRKIKATKTIEDERQADPSRRKGDNN